MHEKISVKSCQTQHPSLELARRLGNRREIAFSLNFLGQIAHWQGKITEAKQLYQQSLAISRERDDRVEMAATLHDLGETFEWEGAYSEAKQLYQQSLAISREIGHPERIAYSLDKLGTVAFWLGEYTESEQYYRESLALFKEIGNRFGMAKGLGGLGLVALGTGAKLAEAKSLLEEGLTIVREIGHRNLSASHLAIKGYITVRLEEYQEAQGYFQEGLTISKELDFPGGMALNLIGLGRINLRQENFQAAREYLHQALQTAMKFQLLPWVMQALGYLVALMAKEGDLSIAGNTIKQRKKKQALELLAFILQHRATWQISKDQAAQYLADLEAELPPEVVAKARERGKTKTLAEVVAEILGEK